MTLQEIRERRAAKTAEARAIVNKAESEKRSLTSDETSTFDAIREDITNLESQESRQQFLDDAERRQIGMPIDHPAESLAKGICWHR
jgi:hypothetical protein